jgi:oligopeptidase A
MFRNVQTDELREIHDECEEMISEFATETAQNTAYYNAVQAIADSAAFQSLSAAKQKEVKLALRDFKLAGVHLPPDAKARLADISKELTKLESKFSANILDATDAWTYHTTDLNELKGLPESDLANAASEAKKRNLEGWVLTLKMPVMMSVMKFLDNRYLRKIYFHAYNTRASDVEPNAGKWDNGPIIEDIMRLRHEKAKLLGFNNYAEYSVSKKMAKSPQEVMDFLNKLADKSVVAAKRELAEMQAFAAKDGVTELQAWDTSYYAEKLRLHKYDFSQETLRPYFPLEKVLTGYFNILNTLYGLTVRETNPVDTWHPDVRNFDIYDESQQFLGSVLVDLYARPKKRDGAWMDDCRSRLQLADGSSQYPIAYLTTNFAKPEEGKPSLLKEDNLRTLFHEFGHCLHHVLTKVNVKSVTGTNGVPWDGIEFPSQFMENFIYTPETIKLISGHYETGEMLPDEIFQRMLAAKNFGTAMQTVRQLQFALFDFRLHLEYDPAKGARALQTLTEVQAKVSPLQLAPDDNRFYNQFQHIFANSYSAGYYSYKWAEVLAFDAFSRFDEAGVLSPEVGRDFMHCILEQGGVPDLMEAFVKFRGRPPKIDAMLRYTGLDDTPSISVDGRLSAPMLFTRRLTLPDTEMKLEEETPSSSFSLN